jgi:NAD(P)-dependent dehydrogenase (short-subunit alcohol dehydrogenase family)
VGDAMQTFVITGCTTGTGLAAARAVAMKGGDVVMLNRASERAEVAERLVGVNRARSIPTPSVSTLPGGRVISLQRRCRQNPRRPQGGSARGGGEHCPP